MVSDTAAKILLVGLFIGELPTSFYLVGSGLVTPFFAMMFQKCAFLISLAIAAFVEYW